MKKNTLSIKELTESLLKRIEEAEEMLEEIEKNKKKVHNEIQEIQKSINFLYFIKARN